MAGMYGADVAQLKQLASQFERCATQLDGDRMTVGNAIRVSAWIGPVAVRFRHEWDSSHSRKVASAAARLREAATALRRNAEEQERASSADGGALGPSAGGELASMHGGGRDYWAARGVNVDGWPEVTLGVSPSDVVDGLADVIGAADALGTIAEVAGLKLTMPKILGPLGVMFDTAGAIDSASGGDWIGAALSGGSGAAGAVAVIAPAAGPLGLGISVAKTFVDWTIPYSAESQSATYDKGVELMFGKGVDSAHLSMEQSQAMSRRYGGPWGWANMISDRMNATADELFPWNWK